MSTNKDAYRFSVRDDTSFRVTDPEAPSEYALALSMPEGFLGDFSFTGNSNATLEDYSEGIAMFTITGNASINIGYSEEDITPPPAL